MPEVELSLLAIADGIVELSWTGDRDWDRLEVLIRAATEDVLARGVAQRVELRAPSDDRYIRRTALRSGFRVEGVRRGVLRRPDGSSGDQTLFARLLSDEIGGPVGFSAVMNTALPRKRLIAHVLMRDTAGRILLCETRFKTDWELPGGIVEADESPRVGAIREVAEELGVDRPLGRLLAVDWMPSYLGWDDALELIFDGGLVSEDELTGFTLQPSEIAAVRLLTLEQARPYLTPLSARRLTAITGLSPGETALLENGSPLGPAS